MPSLKPRRLARRLLRTFIGALGLVWILAPSLSHADDTPPPASSWKLSGFGTLGLTRSNADQADFVQDLSQPNGSHGQWTPKVDSKFGIQLNARLSETYEAVAQVVSRYRYDGSTSPELTWAFLRADINPQTAVRIGRLGTEFYMLADSRLVGYSYLTVRPPVDYFSVLPFTYIDGIDAAYTLPLSGALIRGKIYAGYTGEKIPFIDQPWDLSGSPMRGVHVDYQRGPWQARLGYADIRFSREMPIGSLLTNLQTFGFGQTAGELAVRDKMHRFYSAGLVYDEGPLQAQLMLGYTRRDTTSFENTHNGYLLVGYRIQQLTPFVGYSWVYSSKKPRNSALAVAPPLDDAVQALMDDAHNNQHTYFLGGRWDVTSTVALKAQLDLIRGTADSRFTVRNDSLVWNGRSNVFTLALDFIF